MPFQTLDIKGIPRYLMDVDLEGEPLHLHVSEVGPGEQAHPPHQHGGYEAFYLLEGAAILEFGDERVHLAAGESAVFDPHQLHGLVNAGDRPLRYVVILVNGTIANP